MERIGRIQRKAKLFLNQFRSVVLLFDLRIPRHEPMRLPLRRAAQQNSNSLSDVLDDGPFFAAKECCHIG